MPFRRKDSPYWWVSYTDPTGNRIRRSSGHTRKSEARALEVALRHESNVYRKSGKKPDVSFDALMVRYLSETESKSTNQRDRTSCKPLYLHFAGQKIESITAQDINDYITKRRKQKRKDATIIRELRLFSTAINYANSQWDWGIKNVVKGRIPSTPEGRLRWLTRQEYERLLHAARDSRAWYLAPMIELAVLTGMRRGEILGLTWDRVDLENGLIYFQPEDVKGKRFQSVPLNKKAVNVLKRLRRDCQWVFHDHRYHRITSIKTAWQKAVRDSKLKDVTFHTLRHTTASWLVQSGVSLTVVGELLRHRDVSTTSRYSHLAPENVKKAVENL